MKSESLNTIAWNKFKKDKMAFSSFFFILFLTLISIIPYVFMIDKTEYASKMNLDLATLPPLTTISTVTFEGEEVLTNNVIENKGGISFYSLSSSP